MIDILVVDTENPPLKVLETLFREYMTWGNTQFSQRYQYTFDIESLIEEDLRTLDSYSIEQGGRLLLAMIDDLPVGHVGLHEIARGIGEIKRLYVRPEGRGHGIARLMLENLKATAEDYGFTKLRLDTSPFMHEAQALYRSMGFREIMPYPETTMPPVLWPVTLFMELDLDPIASPAYEAVGYEAAEYQSLGHWMYSRGVPDYVRRFYHL